MSAESKRIPKSQSAPSGGPPKPPKATARGLEDGSPGPDPSRLDFVEAKLRMAKRLIEETSKQLHDYPDLSVASRAKMQTSLEDLRSMQRKYHDQKKEIHDQESEGE